MKSLALIEQHAHCNSQGEKMAAPVGVETSAAISINTQKESTTMDEKKIEIVLMTITPEMAQSLIDIGSPNRPLRKQRVIRYADDMTAGRWVLNTESIKSNPIGEVADGNHRLHACVMAGVPFTTFFARNVPNSAFVTFDSGVGRTLADKLYMRGVKNAMTVAGAVNNVWGYDQGGVWNDSQNVRATHREALAFYKRTSPRAWDDAVTHGRLVRKLMRGTHAAAAHYIFQRVSPGRADDFFLKLHSGANLHEDSAILRLRNRLTANAANDQKLPSSMIMGLVFKAWNLYLAGRGIKQLRLGSNEPFPVVEGFNDED